MTAEWTHSDEDRTIAEDAPHDFATVAPSPSAEPWAEQPTRMFIASYDCGLDATFLFSDLPPVVQAEPAMAMGGGVALMLPPSAVMMPVLVHARSTAPTVRTRRAAPARAGLVTAICGSLALVAAVTACLFYSAAPQAKTTRSSRDGALASLSDQPIRR